MMNEKLNENQPENAGSEINTYAKYCPNVFVAKCVAKHEKGETVVLTTKRGSENSCIIHNFLFEREGYFYYSITRSDGYNMQERATKKAERYAEWSKGAEKKSEQYYKASHSITEHIPLGQPILVGHHSEKRHRRDLESAWNNMGKSVEFSNKSDDHKSKSAYWQSRANDINLSMPESLEYFAFELENAKKEHEGLKSGTIERRHSFSLTYAKKRVNELTKKHEMAKRLWGE